MKNYLLVSSDTYDVNDAVTASYAIASERLKRKVWPLYRRTSFATKILHGDYCLIYTAGGKKISQCVVASARVHSVERGRRSDLFEIEELLVDSPDRVINFETVNWFHKPISLRPLLKKLEITKYTA
ncbi:hypothetical protein OA238_c18890 [Octadecabacter arcticus 238]|uniref:Uncharacterized protein n=1 Tax=Octadecabacter arcticus 238 TaxID=391616 RepID=M9RHF5_9RHOB|nr:hypothetical protein OA238_c18890 [Octadecabacter arcticus 238]